MSIVPKVFLLSSAVPRVVELVPNPKLPADEINKLPA
jgi:hypothetical protein